MVAPIKISMTLDDFKGFIALPENEGRLFELINGEISEVMPGRTRTSEIGNRLIAAVYAFCKAHQLPCRTSGPDGAYNILGNVVAPDFAFKTTPTSDEYPDPIPPLWAVEVIFPTDKPEKIAEKRTIYINAGILYWELYPKSRLVQVYAPGKPMTTAGIDDTLDGGDALPGFALLVRELFEE